MNINTRNTAAYKISMIVTQIKPEKVNYNFYFIKEIYIIFQKL